MILLSMVFSKTPALTEMPLQGKSQTPGGDLYNLWRQQSNFLGIIDEDAIGAIFLLDKCRQGLQVGAFCCHPKFDFDRDSHSSGMSENEVHFRAAPCAIVGGRPGNALHGGETEQDFLDDKAFESRSHAGPYEELIQGSDPFEMA